MSVYQESGIELDLSATPQHEKHDTINTVLGGVDFQIIEPTGQLWLEMKSWSPNVIPTHRRGGQRRSYLSKMRSGKFGRELREKFLGTCTFLTLTGAPPAAPILYVLLLESTPADSALRSHMMTRMRSMLPRSGSRARAWMHTIEVVVVDTTEWNARFPSYPARLLP
ncbi:hypothetical protein [Armatimonas sp.]|uniref:hypothetical protein n=1 Tax=Armatimonas sp. TaxID=1872638 RepID=UPI00374D66AF